MTGKMLSAGAHRCFGIMGPIEAGVFAQTGARWQCDDCRMVWQLKRGADGLVRWTRETSE